VKKISKKNINIYNSSKYTPGSYITVKGKYLKISNIGRTFLDMLCNPSLCGGIYHVLDVYQENAKRYLRLIVDEVDRHGSAIDKVRVGYVLDERLGLSEPRLEKWREKVQRGGSRKLVADAPYKSVFSEKWCLSINIEDSSE
jgi:predicted transcriptional regulator of viral defense system